MIINKALDEIEKTLLLETAKSLPENEPVGAEGETITIADMLPELTQSELDYIFENYTGNMSKGKSKIK